MPNDIAAFEWVRGGRRPRGGHGRTRTPTCIAVATDVTGTNDEDGVAAFLSSL